MLRGRDAPAQNEAPSAQTSIDVNNALRMLRVTRMLAELAGFVAMLLALALCRVRRILSGTGWRIAKIHPKRCYCKTVGLYENAVEASGAMQTHIWSTIEVSSSRKSRQRPADAGVYDHLRRGKPTDTLIALCGL